MTDDKDSDSDSVEEQPIIEPQLKRFKAAPAATRQPETYDEDSKKSVPQMLASQTADTIDASVLPALLNAY